MPARRTADSDKNSLRIPCKQGNARTALQPQTGAGMMRAGLGRNAALGGNRISSRLTGPFASTGRQIEAATNLYIAQHGDTVAGRKIQLLVQDNGGVADQTKRIAQEMIVNQKVSFLTGFGLPRSSSRSRRSRPRPRCRPS